MSERKLFGYLTTGKYNVNDYEIHVERIDEGARIRIRDGNGEVREAVIRDGEPGMSEEEVRAARELLERTADALSTWTANEEERNAQETERETNERERERAEAARELAEHGDPETDTEGMSEGEIEAYQMSYRQGLYELMLALYKKLRPGVDDMLREAEEARDAAMAYRDETLQQLFYHDGDRLMFNASGDPGTPKTTTIQVCDEISSELNIGGYAAGATRIHLKLPCAKRLDKIDGAVCESLVMSVYCEKGETMNRAAGDHYDYKGHVTKIIIDKVQNCIGLILQRTDGSNYYNITGKETLRARVGFGTEEMPAIVIRLTGETPPEAP